MPDIAHPDVCLPTKCVGEGVEAELCAFEDLHLFPIHPHAHAQCVYNMCLHKYRTENQPNFKGYKLITLLSHICSMYFSNLKS